MKLSRITAALLAALSLELPAAAADDGIQAVVHDHPITEYDVVAPLQDIFYQLERQTGQQDPRGVVKRENDLATQNLNELINDQLILHEFATAGYNLPESLVDEYVQEQAARIGDLATFTKTLQEQGMTYERFREQQRNNLILQIMRDKNIASAVIISPHKIEAYYGDHKDDYRVEDEVKLGGIALRKTAGTDGSDTTKLAGEILAKLKGGAAFNEIAATYSSADLKPGGDWGWFSKSALRKEFVDPAFTLEPGQISGVIDTPEACYILKVEDRHEAHFRPLSEVRDDIEHTLLAEERNRLQKQWLERLKKKTFVTYF
jgi:parvulin-like peptidyl-prolyl isomerase